MLLFATIVLLISTGDTPSSVVEVATLIVAALSFIVAVVGVLIVVVKRSDEALTPGGVRQWWGKVRDEHRFHQAKRLYARCHLSPLRLRLGMVPPPRPGDQWRMNRLVERSNRAVTRLVDRHRLRATPEIHKIAGEQLLMAAQDYARRWDAKVKAMMARWRDEHSSG